MHLLVLRSSEAHSRRRGCLLLVEQTSFAQIVFRVVFCALGQACIESAPLVTAGQVAGSEGSQIHVVLSSKRRARIGAREMLPKEPFVRGEL